MDSLFELIKKTAVLAVEQTHPTEIRYGTVVEISPLMIRLSEKMIPDSEIIEELETTGIPYY